MPIDAELVSLISGLDSMSTYEEHRRLAWAAYYAQQQPARQPQQSQQPVDSGYTQEQRAVAWTAYYAQLAAHEQQSPQAALGYQQQLTQPAGPDCWPDGTPKRYKTSRHAAAGTAGPGLDPQPRPAAADATGVEASASSAWSAEAELAPEPAAKRQKPPTECEPSPAQPSVAALCAAAATGDVHETRRQLEAGVNINSLGPGGKSALMLACEHGDSMVAVALLDATPPPAINQKGKEGKAALHYAIINDDKGLVRLLLDYHADPVNNTADGVAPIELASSAHKSIGKMVKDAIFSRRNVNHSYMSWRPHM